MSERHPDRARVFLLPEPARSRRLEIVGPEGRRRCRTAGASRAALHQVLERLADEESDSGEGWSIWWGTTAFVQGHQVLAWLWPEDDAGGARSFDLLMTGLVSDGFRVERSTRVSAPRQELRGPLACRDRGARAGTCWFPELRYKVDPRRTAPHYEPTSPFSRQHCPSCGDEVLPRIAIWGEPSRRWRPQIALGEAVAVGCLPGAPGNAVCPSCWATFMVPS